jgi:hypothetical protein
MALVFVRLPGLAPAHLGLVLVGDRGRVGVEVKAPTELDRDVTGRRNRGRFPCMEGRELDPEREPWAVFEPEGHYIERPNEVGLSGIRLGVCNRRQSCPGKHQHDHGKKQSLHPNQHRVDPAPPVERIGFEPTTPCLQSRCSSS